jgi:crotonobetainyl-CoA:carnitine CoA-transferase CaiB-like acyl-CoA transferase
MKHDKDGEFPRKFQRISHAIAMQNPEFDQHNEEILSEIGYSKDAIVEPKEEDIIR